MMYITRLYKIISLLFVLILHGCTDTAEPVWKYSDKSISVFGEFPSDCSISWQGNDFNGVAHGDGLLTITLPDNSSQSRQVIAHYGALDTRHIRKVGSEEYFIGKIKKKKYSGYGVLLKDEDIYVGNFTKGKPDGNLSLYRKGKLFYTGEWKEGAFNGEGTLHREDGSVKSGIWKSGKLISAEVIIDFDNGRYEGYVSDGKPNGYGKCTYNGSIYEGDWEKGKWNGLGTLSSENQEITVEWKKGKPVGNAIITFGDFEYDGMTDELIPDGYGTLTYQNDQESYIYAGEWAKGMRHGYGDTVFSNGDSYFGEWNEDSYHGIGRYRYNNGDVYDGEWENNLQHGKGQYFSETFTYSGEWKGGLIDGKGRIDYANHDTYEGEFKEGLKNGYGIYEFASGNLYEGQFVDDRIQGLGVFTFADGNWYEGEFADGKISGNGTLYIRDTTGIITLTAFWDKPNGFPSEGSLSFPNGDIYEGPLFNGEPTAEGIWAYKDKATGEYIVANGVKQANEFYKQHRETINKVVIYTSIALTAIEFVAYLAAPVTSGATLAVVPILHTTQKALNVADMAVSITSTSIDLASSDSKEEIVEQGKQLAAEVAVNAAFILLPKATKKIAGSTVGVAAANAVKTSMVKLSKQKLFAQVIRITTDKKKRLILAFEKSTFGQKYYRLTTRPSYQYVTDDQVKKICKNNKKISQPQFNSEARGDGKTLGKNALTYMSEKARKRYNVERRILGSRRAQWHHVIAGNIDSPSAEECRRILKRFKIDINDPRNAILLPVEPRSIMRGTLHGKHVSNYDDYIYARLKQAKSQAQCLEIMDDLKKEIYKGRIQLLKTHRVNTALRTATKESMY